MFEAPPAYSGVVNMPQTAEGDGDEDPIDIVLNAAAHGASVTFAPPGGATQLGAQRPSLVADVPHAPQFAAANAGQPPAQAAPQPRNWTVQVGEFHSGRQATQQVDLVADSFKSQFDDREGLVAHVGHRYGAVFTGFTETEARQACATVTARGLPCAPSPR